MTNEEKIAALFSAAMKLSMAGSEPVQQQTPPPVTVPPNASQPPQQNTPPVNNTLPNGTGGMTPTPLDLNAVKNMTADEINNRWDEVSKLLQGESAVGANPNPVTNIGV